MAKQERLMIKILLALNFLLFFLMVDAKEIIFQDEVKGGIVVDQEGNIFATTWDDLIAKYSLKGKYLFTIGKKGEGPGDIKRLSGYTINPKDGNLYVVEYVGGNKWISIFSSKDGTFLGTYDIELDWKEWEGLYAIKFDLFGNAFVGAVKDKVRSEKDCIIGELTSEVMKFSPDGSFLGHIITFSEDFWIAKPGKGQITIPFRNHLIWDQWNDKIVVGETMNSFLKILDLNGRIIKNIYLPLKKERLKKENIDEWKNRMGEHPMVKKGLWDLDFVSKRIKFPQYKPIFNSLTFDKKGNILVRKSEIHGGGEKAFWVKINIKSGKEIKRKFTSDYILFIDENFIYVERKLKEQDKQILKLERKDYGL